MDRFENIQQLKDDLIVFLERESDKPREERDYFYFSKVALMVREINNDLEKARL